MRGFLKITRERERAIERAIERGEEREREREQENGREEERWGKVEKERKRKIEVVNVK